MAFRLTVSLFFLSVAAVFPQALTVFDKYNRQVISASPSFSDPNQYNSYDFCGSPIGLFDRDSLRLRLNTGLDLARWGASGNSDSLAQGHTSWSAPDLYIGVPKTFFTRLYYAPTNITMDFPVGLGVQKTSFPLHAFGMTIAGQIPGGLFQVAIQGKGYIGDAEVEGSQNTRMVKGMEDLSLTMGSRIHELVAIGMQGGAQGQFDTLRDFASPIRYDRCFNGQIPMLGWYIDFGKEDFPVQSALSINTATHRFVYVSGGNENRNPIKGDSIAWKWQTSGLLQCGRNVLYPALLFGYWRTHYQPYAPTATNDNLDVGPAWPGSDWTFKDLYWGPGVSASLFSFINAWTEYTYSSMRLEYGSAWTAVTDKKQGHHRTMAGIDASLHSIPWLRFPSSVEAFLRIGWFNTTDNSGIDGFRSKELGRMVQVITDSRMYRYEPNFGWDATERTTGLVLGIGGRFFNGLIESDIHMGFLNTSMKTERSGMLFRADLGYMVR
jgi:hypothetical protein